MNETPIETFTCVDCKQTKPVLTDGGTGYATFNKTEIVCYDCCAPRDKAHMEETGKAFLYWTGEPERYKITNWCGSLVINPTWTKTRKSFAFGHRVTRIDFWFTLNGKNWHGVSKTNNGTYLRAKRLKN